MLITALGSALDTGAWEWWTIGRVRSPLTCLAFSFLHLQLHLQLLPPPLFLQNIVLLHPQDWLSPWWCVSAQAGSEGVWDRVELVGGTGTACSGSCWGHIQGMNWHGGWGVKELGEEEFGAETLGHPSVSVAPKSPA